jgi:hypothetical protein
MVAYDPCDPSIAPIDMTPGFPGWKASIVEPNSPRHEFYSAQHAHFAISCGASAGEYDHLSYKFDLIFEAAGGMAQHTVSFEKSIYVSPGQEATKTGPSTVIKQAPSPKPR